MVERRGGIGLLGEELLEVGLLLGVRLKTRVTPRMGVSGARGPRSSARRTCGLSEPSRGTEGVSSMGPRMRGAGACAKVKSAESSRAETDESRASRGSLVMCSMIFESLQKV